MKETLDNSNDPILEECLQALRSHGENFRRQQRLSDSIDRMAAAAPPARRRPLFLYYTLGGVAACLALFFLFSRFSGTSPKPMPDAEVAMLQEVPDMSEPSPAEGMVAGMVTAEEGVMPETLPEGLSMPKSGASTRAVVPVVTETVALVEEEPANGNFALAVTAMHPQSAVQEAVVADALPADRTEAAGTVETALPLPADSLPMAVPSAEIFTLHTLVSYSQPVRERKLRLPFRRSAEQSRESSSATSLLTINLQSINH